MGSIFWVKKIPFIKELWKHWNQEWGDIVLKQRLLEAKLLYYKFYLLISH